MTVVGPQANDCCGNFRTGWTSCAALLLPATPGGMASTTKEWNVTTQDITRLPRHIGFIPDGNRRWAVEKGLPKQDGYAFGIAPGLAQRRIAGGRRRHFGAVPFRLETVHGSPGQWHESESSCQLWMGMGSERIKRWQTAIAPGVSNRPYRALGRWAPFKWFSARSVGLCRHVFCGCILA